MIKPGKILFLSIMILSTFACRVLHAQEMKNGLLWYTDINKVYELSNKSHKPVFAFFTGSDWCGWCHRMQANVFDKPGFKAWAKKNVILLELDFPRTKKLPDQLIQQNNSLQQAFNVQGFPTVWLFHLSKDSTANKFNIAALGSLGYPQAEEGKEETAFLATANELLKKK